MEIVLRVNLIKVGKKYLCLARIGGFDIEGEPMGDPEAAYKKFLWKLSGSGTPDGRAELAIGLLVQGTDLKTEIRRQATDALPAGPSTEEAEPPFGTEPLGYADWTDPRTSG